MGRGFTQYSFPESDAEDVFNLYSAFLNYRLHDDSLLHVRQSECWCNACNRISMAEHVESIDELESELQRLLNPDEEHRQMIAFIGTPIEDLIVESRQRIQWRNARTEPAKCLECGSTNFVPLPSTDEFRHPYTGERVQVVSRGFADAAPWYAEFTPQGDLIEGAKNRT